MTFVTVTVMVCVSVSKPSETCTITMYVLLAPLSAGFSKSGAAMKVSTPVEALMLKKAASAPPDLE